jgi:hypothetical protein
MAEVVTPLEPSPSAPGSGVYVVVVVVAVAAGVLTGWFVGKNQSGVVSPRGGSSVVKSIEKPGNEEGIRDPKRFPDKAEGMVKINDGKITREGTHVLVRGDVSQNAYLTSANIDLEKYVDKKVEVMGQTNKAQKAGWLLDVGWIKVNE